MCERRRRTKDEEGEEGEGEDEEKVASYPGGKRREKWPGIHGLCMHEKPHDFMGYRIPSFANG